MRCPSCQQDNPTRAKFCLECGRQFALTCAECRVELPAGAKFCVECGASLQGSGADTRHPTPHTRRDLRGDTPMHFAHSPPRAVVVDEHETRARLADGERKTVTALFADIKGSMALIEDLDPEEARAIIDPALALMMDAVHRYDGYVVQSTGDGIFALFGAPVAHEDHPQRALYAGLRMQDEMKRYAERLRAEKGINLLVRVGVNTGEVVVRSLQTGGAHTEYTPIGHSTSLASRLQALASPGAVLMSEMVRRLVEG